MSKSVRRAPNSRFRGKVVEVSRFNVNKPC